MKLEIVSWLKPMLEYLWLNKKSILSKIETKDDFFDYPDYAGLPKKIINNLSSDNVDTLQMCLVSALGCSKTKKEFFEFMLDDLSGGLIKAK